VSGSRVADRFSLPPEVSVVVGLGDSLFFSTPHSGLLAAVVPASEGEAQAATRPSMVVFDDGLQERSRVPPFSAIRTRVERPSSSTIWFFLLRCRPDVSEVSFTSLPVWLAGSVRTVNRFLGLSSAHDVTYWSASTVRSDGSAVPPPSASRC